MSKLKEISPATYLLERENGMRVPGLIIATPELLSQPDMDKPLDQVRNVAHLPGIVGYSIAMPDMHWGYGFPIGGVAATDATYGVISPGGVGYDINCGVRLAIVPLAFKDINAQNKQAVLKRIFQLVPSGVGHGHRGKQHQLTDSDYRNLTTRGAAWSIDQGFGFQKDLAHMESHGCIEGADIDAVSEEAKMRARDQLGSIGSGNHFVEMGEVSHLFMPEIAHSWGIEKGQTYLLIHSGSRGFGHQICQDALNTFIKQGYAEGLPDRQLVAAPVLSKAGQYYLAAMAAAANFAFNNRQQILHATRLAFQEIFGILPEKIPLIYDVCHNIAKFETHNVNGIPQRLCVHRKGATRAFGPRSPELAAVFQDTGQPVLVPGDMGRASYLMVGMGNALTWCSSCHGAGRARSRIKSKAAWKDKDPIEYMKQQNVLVMASAYNTITEEMPDAYKDVGIVVQAVEEAQLAKRVASFRPHLVIKG